MPMPTALASHHLCATYEFRQQNLFCAQHDRVDIRPSVQISTLVNLALSFTTLLTARLASASVGVVLDIQIGDRKISKDRAGKRALRLFIQSRRSLVTLVKAKEASSIVGQLKEPKIIVRQ